MGVAVRADADATRRKTLRTICSDAIEGRSDPALRTARTSSLSLIAGCDEDELDATDILDAYTAQSWSEEDAVADALSRIRGAFALIIHDAAEERVIAARDREVRAVPRHLLEPDAGQSGRALRC